MSFDLDKLQAVAELGEVIRLQNEAIERLAAFRKARPYMMMPNLAKMVEENLKENVTVLYKELNNLHKPPGEQTRYICRICQMAFAMSLPGGICDECRSRQSTSQPRAYVPNTHSTVGVGDEEIVEPSITDEAAEQEGIEVVSSNDEMSAKNDEGGDSDIEKLYASALGDETEPTVANDGGDQVNDGSYTPEDDDGEVLDLSDDGDAGEEEVGDGVSLEDETEK